MTPKNAVVALLFLATLQLSTEHAAAARDLAGRALVNALRGGGYTIYFRHAATDWSNPDRLEAHGEWASCEAAKMRQLSQEGRATARAIGDAIRALGIPVGKVLSSEYCRAADTARAFAFGEVETTQTIMNLRAEHLFGGRDAVVHRARDVFAQPPTRGTNTVIVGHGNLMRAASDAYTEEGGSVVYRPDPAAASGFVLVATLAPGDWTALAARYR